MVLQKFSVETLQETHRGIDLMGDISTVGILFDEFCDFLESSLRFLKVELEFVFVDGHKKERIKFEKAHDFGIFVLPFDRYT